MPANVLTFGDIEIREDEGRTLKKGVDLKLTRTEHRFLLFLAQNAGKVFSREALLAEVWHHDALADGRLVDAHVRRLRTKVEDDPAEPTLIVTVRGLGYRLVPPGN